MVGKTDLRMDLGLNAIGGGEASYEDGMKHVFALAKKYNMPLVGYVPAHETEASVRGGYRMICQAVDFYALGYGVQMSLQQSREVAKKVVDQMNVNSGYL